jgi:hypothetical protein
MDDLPFHPGDLCVYRNDHYTMPPKIELALIVSLRQSSFEGSPRLEWTEIVNGELSNEYRDSPEWLYKAYTVVSAARL